MERIGGLSAERLRDKKAFLRLLRRVRIEAKLTQAQLAKIIGVTQARISKYEQGERRIDMLELKTICDAIKLPLAEFARRFEESCHWKRGKFLIHFGVFHIEYLCWPAMSVSAQRASRKQRERKILLELLRELRKQRSLTQDQLARLIGVKQAFVSKYETGERRLDFLDLVGICDVLGISMVKFVEKFESSRKASK
jgi:transcriptional regulator with XRE-family HTH domain